MGSIFFPRTACSFPLPGVALLTSASLFPASPAIEPSFIFSQYQCDAETFPPPGLLFVLKSEAPVGGNFFFSPSHSPVFYVSHFFYRLVIPFICWYIWALLSVAYRFLAYGPCMPDTFQICALPAMRVCYPAANSLSPLLGDGPPPESSLARGLTPR